MRFFLTLILELLTLISLSSPVFAQPLPSEQERNERIGRLKEIVQASPKDVGTWHDLADIYREGKDWDKAIDAETHAIEGHPKYAVAYYGRGVAQFRKDAFTAARADFTKAIDLWQSNGGLEKFLTLEQPKPEHIDAYRMRGLAWAHENKYAEALADYGIAMKLEKQNPKLYSEKAYLEEKAGKTADATADYKQAGLLYADRGSTTDAGEMIKNLDRLNAKDASVEIQKRLDAAKPKSDLP